jgi:hypothetical protein
MDMEKPRTRKSPQQKKAKRYPAHRYGEHDKDSRKSFRRTRRMRTDGRGAKRLRRWSEWRQLAESDLDAA